MSPQASVRRHRQVDIRIQQHCAPAFAAQSLQNSVLLHLACPLYVPQHAQQAPTTGPSAELLSGLPPRVAAILAGPEPSADGKDTALAAAAMPAVPHHHVVASGVALQGSVPAAPSTRPAGSPDDHPRKRVCRVAGLQPRPLCWPPDAAAVALLLRAACAPFDISLEPALQHLAPAAQPLVLQAPAAAEDAAPAGKAAGCGTAGGSTDGQGTQAQRPLPPQPVLLPVLAHPCSHPPTPQQAAVLRACAEADAGRPSAARQLAAPAVLAGYQEDWLEVAPTTLSMWEQAPFEPYALQKPVLFYVLAAEEQRQAAGDLLRSVSGAYAACRLGSHEPAPSAVLTFVPGDGAALGLDADLNAAAAPLRQLPDGDQQALLGLCSAARRLQQRLRFDPPQLRLPSVGLQQHQIASLAVYALCPSAHPAAPAIAQLLAAACLAPCLPEAAASDAAVQPLVSRDATKQNGDVHGVQHALPAQASPQPMDVVSAPASGAGPLQPIGSSSCHQPPSNNSAAAQHNMPPDKAPTSLVVSTPSAEAVVKYHGAALQTHVLKDTPPAADVHEAGPHVQPAECSPVDIAVQVVSQRAMADITGAALRALAMSLFAKVVRRQQPAGAASGEQAAEALRSSKQEVLHEPLFILAPALRSAAPAEEQAGAMLPLASQRTLHCCYACPLDGGRPAVLVATDECGELLHSQLLGDTADMGIGTLAAPADAQAAATCRRVLSAALDTWHAACSGGSVAMRRIVIARLGAMPAAEQRAWRKALHSFQLPSLPMSGSVQLEDVAVVALHADPPVRLLQPWDDLRASAYAYTHMSPASPAAATVVLAPPWPPAAPLLPGEVDTVRLLHVALHASRTFTTTAEQPADSAAAEAGTASAGAGSAPSAEAEMCVQIAEQLHGLAVLGMAHQRLAIAAPLASGGHGLGWWGWAGVDAHLPLHAAAARRALIMLHAASGVLPLETVDCHS